MFTHITIILIGLQLLHEEPRRNSRRMSHRSCRGGHGHIVPLPSIKDPHPHQTEELGLVGRQVPSPEEPFHEPVNGKSVVEQVILLT